MDSIGVLFGRKEIQGKTMIAMGLRGGNYEREWASNFTIGDKKKTVQHEGFAFAAEQCEKALENYIDKYEISGDIMLWSVGYSRGAATNNLLSGLIDRKIKDNTLFSGKVNLKKEDFYSYCFETPCGASFEETLSPRDEFYSNIQNVINCNDAVPMLPFQGFHFTRYGKDHFSVDSLRNKEYEKNIKIVEKYFSDMDNAKNLGDYVIPSFSMKTRGKQDALMIAKEDCMNFTSGIFLSSLLNAMKEEIGNLDHYVSLYQNGLREISYVLYQNGTPKVDMMEILFSLSKALLEQYDIDMLINNLLYDTQSFTDDLSLILYQTLKKLGFVIEINTFTTCLKNLLKLFSNVFYSHIDYFFTLLDSTNLQALLSAHYPELCLSHLMSQDTNFTKNPLPYDDSGSYLVFRVNEVQSNSEISIFDNENNLLSSFKEGKLDSKSSVPNSIQKNVFTCYLSKEANYRVEIKNVSSYSLYSFDQTKEYLQKREVQKEENDNLVTLSF